MTRDEYEAYENRYELKQAHQRLLEILLEFDHHCRNHDICYSLADGTLLGMIRHGSFIPWDDDADVMVTREEYKKLISTLKRDDNIVIFKACFLDRVSTRNLLKLGYYIDLFVNDVMPANKWLFKIKVVITGILRTYFYGNTVENVWHRKDSWIKAAVRNMFTSIIGRIMCFLYEKKDIFATNDKVADIKHASMSAYYTRFTSRMFETKRRFDKNSYDIGYIDVKFANMRLMAIRESEAFLSDMYGNYSMLPPEEKRCPSHPVNMLNSIEKCLKFYN